MMNKKIRSIFCLLLCFSILFCFTGCKKRYEVESIYYYESVPGGVDVLVEVPVEDDEIDNALNSSNTSTGEDSSDNEDNKKSLIYYVSNKGSDANDGLSEQTPWATINKVNTASLSPGDKVLFCRGDEWRGESISCIAGVSYGAYGNGANPVFNGSKKNYAVENLWILTDQANVYKLDEKFKVSDDVGNIIFNNGNSCGIKVRNGFAELTEDLSFYHNNDGYVYLRCDNGNPAKVFSVIDVVPRIKLMEAKAYNVIENLTFKFANYGITTSNHRFGEVDSVEIRDCKFSWIGGCIASADNNLRLGNAIEFWGSCSNMLIENCEFTQIFDTAITAQFTSTATVDTVIARNNKIDKCFWGMEFWLQGDGKSVMKNITIEGNVFTNTAEGWSSNQRWASVIIHGAHISDLGYKDFKRENFVVKNNIFGNSAAMLMKLSGNNWTPKIEGNTYKQYKNMAFGYISDKNYTFNDEFINNFLKKIDTKAVASYY